jgi:hypothetical protein
MTTPKAATDTGRGRTYKVHDQVVPSVTTVLGQVLAKPALLGSAVKITGDNAIDQYAVLGQMIADKGPDQARQWLKGIYRAEWKAKADIGTAVHHGVHMDILGTPEWPADHPGHLTAWEAFKADFSPTFLMAEATVFSLRPGHAGTLDILCRIGTPARTGLVDVKTGSSPKDGGVWLEEMLQLAAYRYSPTILLPDGTDAPMPTIDFCAILHLRAGGYALTEVPEADENAYRHFLYLLALYNFQREHGTIGTEVRP